MSKVGQFICRCAAWGLNRPGIRSVTPDAWFLRARYYQVFNRRLHLDNPRTFNEKLQWLKLNNRKQCYTAMVDKYEVKKYVAAIIGEEHVIPTLGVWDNAKDIEWDALPNEFVLKCTHDCGSVIICRDKSKLDLEETQNWLDKKLSRNYFWNGREWPYKNVKPRILAEKYICDKQNAILPVLKIFNFCGEAKILQYIHQDKTTDETVDYYDVDWNRLNIRQNYPNSRYPYNRPNNFEKMLNMAEQLSQDIPFLRTDFYSIGNHFYFSELTFYSDCGFGIFDPPEYDDILGDWLCLT